MSFEVIDNKKHRAEIVYFEDVKSQDGFKGYTSCLSINTFRAQIEDALMRLGADPYMMIYGRENNRYGYLFQYRLNGAPCELKVLGLPLSTPENHPSFEKRKEQSIRMALFNVRDWLEALWNVQMLMPGYMGLLPTLLVESGKTIGDVWIESRSLNRLLPEPKDDYLDGEFVEE